MELFSTHKLTRHRVAILAAHGFEELELIEPLRALQAEGAEVDVIAPQPGPIQAMHFHYKTLLVNPDRVMANTVLPEQYDSLLLPGGAISADTLRTHRSILDFVRAIDEAEKPIAAISHGAWVLISAGIVANRKMTSFPSLKDDLLNAGAIWTDEPVAIDDNLITARSSHDLAAFDSALVEAFSRRPALISPGTRHLMSRSRIA
jgi:protease I